MLQYTVNTSTVAHLLSFFVSQKLVFACLQSELKSTYATRVYRFPRQLMSKALLFRTHTEVSTLNMTCLTQSNGQKALIPSSCKWFSFAMERTTELTVVSRTLTAVYCCHREGKKWHQFLVIRMYLSHYSNIVMISYSIISTCHLFLLGTNFSCYNNILVYLVILRKCFLIVSCYNKKKIQ